MSAVAREAVVVIHGIGEQRPLDTLRSFVRGASRARIDATEDRGGVALPEDRCFPGAAPLTGRLYERRLITVWEQGDDPAVLVLGPDHLQGGEHATDCYEFYWAYRYRDSTLGQLVSFFLPLLKRRRRSFTSLKITGHDGTIRSRRANRAWRAAAAALTTGSVVLGALLVAHELGTGPAILTGPVAVGAALLSIGGLLTALGCGILATIRTALVSVALWSVALGAFVTGHSVDLSWLKGSVAGTVTAMLGSLAVATLVRSLGDVARYLGATPDDVEPTNDLLAGVVQLLEALHDDIDEDTGTPTYDRIVVVGHSLGSVIAYDALNQLWARRASAMPLSHDLEQRVAELEELALEKDDSGRPRIATERFDAERFQRAQGRLLDGLRRVGTDGNASGRWIVTDLVTVGSPLAHADALLAHDAKDLEARTVDRSISTAPPQPRRTPSSHPYRRERYRTYPGLPEQHFSSLPESAVFLAVRWTNVYVNHDIVAGPVAPLFGPAVVDRSLGSSGWLGRFLWPRQYPHSSYWTFSDNRYLGPLSRESVAILRGVIRRRPALVVDVPEEPLADVVAMVDDWVALQLSTDVFGSEARVPLDIVVSDGAGRHYRSTFLDLRPTVASVAELCTRLGPSVDVCLYVSSNDPERIKAMNGEPRQQNSDERLRVEQLREQGAEPDEDLVDRSKRKHRSASECEVEPAPVDDSQRV